MAHGPGCCGVVGPVPSATLDKRCQLQQQRKNSKTYFGVKGYETLPGKEARISWAVAGSLETKTTLIWDESDFQAQGALKIVDTRLLPLFNETGVFHDSAKSCLGVQ